MSGMFCSFENERVLYVFLRVLPDICSVALRISRLAARDQILEI